MSSKIELLIYVVFLVATWQYLLKAEKKLFGSGYTSKDGYEVTPKQLSELFPSYKTKIKKSVYGGFGGVMPGLLIFLFIFMYMALAGLEIPLSVSWLSSSLIVIVMLITITVIKKGMEEFDRETEEFSKSVLFEIRNLTTGVIQYISNPEKYMEVEEKLMQAEKRLKDATDAFELAEIEYGQAVDKGKENLEWEQLKMDRATSGIRENSNQVILHNKRLQQLLSEDIPVLTADIVKQKGQTLKRTAVPHHIQVLQRIANDTSLPESMREDAQITLEAQWQEKSKTEEQARLQEAQIELDTAKKFI